MIVKEYKELKTDDIKTDYANIIVPIIKNYLTEDQYRQYLKTTT